MGMCVMPIMGYFTKEIQSRHLKPGGFRDAGGAYEDVDLHADTVRIGPCLKSMVNPLRW